MTIKVISKLLFAIRMSRLFLTFIFILGYPSVAMAYVGPGAGITMLGALWAVICAVFIALGGLLVWPIRAYFRRKKKKAESSDKFDQESK